MIECIRRTSRNVKRWSLGRDGIALDRRRNGLQAEQQFRKIIGYQQLAELALAIERDLTQRNPHTATEEPVTLTHS